MTRRGGDPAGGLLRRHPCGRSAFSPVLSCALTLALPIAAAAAPEEIQIYVDDMTPQGHFGLDVHNNYVMSGSGTSDYPGGQPPVHVYRFTPEFYYGLRDTVELGLYALTTHPVAGDTNFDGAKVRVKFIAPHDTSYGLFWGANFELGETSLRVSQYPWNAELKGILGFRTERWLFALNPNLDKAISAGQPFTVDVDSKIAYRTDAGYQVGVESYNELGPVSDMGHLGQHSETVYAVVDTTVRGVDLNAGIGRGLTTESDRWTVKLILGFHF